MRSTMSVFRIFACNFERVTLTCAKCLYLKSYGLHNLLVLVQQKSLKWKRNPGRLTGWVILGCIGILHSYFWIVIIEKLYANPAFNLSHCGAPWAWNLFWPDKKRFPVLGVVHLTSPKYANENF